MQLMVMVALDNVMDQRLRESYFKRISVLHVRPWVPHWLEQQVGLLNPNIALLKTRHLTQAMRPIPLLILTPPILTRRATLLQIEMPGNNICHFQGCTSTKTVLCIWSPEPILYVPRITTGIIGIKWEIISFSLMGVINAAQLAEDFAAEEVEVEAGVSACKKVTFVKTHFWIR